MSHVVTGISHDEARTAEAIEALVERGVPLDEVSVLVRDRAGQHEVPVREEMEADRTALAGGVIGATLGGLGATLMATGVLAAPGWVLLASGPALAALQGVVGGAALGEALGALAGLSHWKDDVDLHAEDLSNGAALVVVHSDDLQEGARQAFEETGADRITG